MKSAIDFNSHIPYYIQLIEILKGHIDRQVWQPGDQIPGETELCEAYGVSRTVVRQALREMVLNGLIIRRKGKGTFVAEPKISESLVQKLTGFYQDMVERGLEPVTKVLHQKVVPANEKVAGYLEIPLKTKVIDIRRLRYVNDEPIVIVTTYIPYQLCPKLATIDLSKRSLYDFLEKECGLFVSRGRRFIEAVPASSSEAKLLGLEQKAPLIMLDSVSYLEDNTPIEYYHALHSGQRTRFEVELVRVREFGKSPGIKVKNLSDLPNGNDIIPE